MSFGFDLTRNGIALGPPAIAAVFLRRHSRTRRNIACRPELVLERGQINVRFRGLFFVRGRYTLRTATSPPRTNAATQQSTRRADVVEKLVLDCGLSR